MRMMWNEACTEESVAAVVQPVLKAVYMCDEVLAGPKRGKFHLLGALDAFQGPRIKLGLIFLGGIEKDKGQANHAIGIARFTEEIHGSFFASYPGFH
jgi:hypothetical protein